MSSENGMIYDVSDKIPFSKNIVLALQQFLAIIAATILVPVIVNGSVSGSEDTHAYLSQSAALIGAGAGTIVYLLFTKFKSPVFLGSSFAFIPALCTGVAFGYFGIILGAVFAGLIYVLLAVVIYYGGTGWIKKYMPSIVIGPTVALIGFSLAGSAVSNISETSDAYVTLIIGLFTFLVVAYVSVKGDHRLRMYPFIIGAIAGYLLALVFTGIGNVANIAEFKIINFSAFDKIGDINNWAPDIMFIEAINQGTQFVGGAGDILSLFVAFAPIAFVVFAEHIADHKNISSIIKQDLFEDPGLHRTLLGDGVGSIAGAFCGGCPNTTYGESIGCVALSKNASTSTILLAAVLCIVIAFFYPLVLFIETIPATVVGGLCIALYGFIAVSGLRMFKDVDLNDSRNLYVVAVIFICGIGGISVAFSTGFGTITISSIAFALVLGIVTNLLLKSRGESEQE